jgi:hypothetical protein
MVVVEVLAGVLVFVLAVFTTVAAFIGLLGMLGAIRLVRCDRCGHLGTTSVSMPVRPCAHCRHGRLFHPIEAVHHVSVLHWRHHARSGG